MNIGPVDVDLSKDARAQSGIGIALGGQGFWRPSLTANTNLLLTLSGNGNFYRQSRFDDVSVAFNAGQEFLPGGEALMSRDVGRETLYARAGYYRVSADAPFSIPPAKRNDRLIDVEAGILVYSHAG